MASRAGLPLRDVIAAAIRGRIIDGSYVPGSRLREEEIASDFDVSRVPVREAFQVLEQQRFLELRKYKGAIVAQPESSGTRELIAIAVGVTRQCDGCITTHVHAARQHGATKEEIAEALGVAIAINAGAALVFSARVMDALTDPPPESHRA